MDAPQFYENRCDSYDYGTRAIITRGMYIFTPFFTAVYIVERLVLQTIYVLKM